MDGVVVATWATRNQRRVASPSSDFLRTLWLGRRSLRLLEKPTTMEASSSATHSTGKCAPQEICHGSADVHDDGMNDRRDGQTGRGQRGRLSAGVDGSYTEQNRTGIGGDDEHLFQERIGDDAREWKWR